MPPAVRLCINLVVSARSVQVLQWVGAFCTEEGKEGAIPIHASRHDTGSGFVLSLFHSEYSRERRCFMSAPLLCSLFGALAMRACGQAA